MQMMDHTKMTPAGLETTSAGHTLVLDDTHLDPSPTAALRFKILDGEGRPVTAYEREHGKDLHLIVVRRDLAHYQHVHPSLSSDGTWSVDLDLVSPGTYRVLADFTPAGGDGLTLGTDLGVRGTAAPAPLPAPARRASVDGYEVELTGEVAAGKEAELDLRVTKDGRPVTDLEPYLGAYGHLVALRSGDLAYLHVHPAGEPGDGATEPGPEVTFFAQVPSTGTYRLYFDFRHEGTVRTAEFTVRAETAGSEGDAERGHGQRDDHRHGEG